MHQIVVSIYNLATWFQPFFYLHNIIDEENVIYIIILQPSDTVGTARNTQTFSLKTDSLKFKGRVKNFIF